ncbi:MAG TPA: peptidase [Lacipirellulaceae bacterium]|nr:peptidase [Lacipirellulaceae bacterium]
MHAFRNFRGALAAFALAAAVAPPVATAQTIQMKDGRALTGRVASTPGVAENPNQPSPQAGEVATRPIYMVDDELRRVYIPKAQVNAVVDSAAEVLVKIRPWQNPSQSAAALVSVGPALGIGPWDEYGRRIYEMQFEGGVLAIVQGITELTPRYAKVEALLGPNRVVTWDMRIATSSIPSDILAKIIAKAIRQDDPQERLQAVRFYTQGKRFHEARKELERIVQEFPEFEDLKAEIAQLRRMAAEGLLKELQLRRGAGQHALVRTLLANFPVDQVGGDTLVQVRELTARYEQEDARITRLGEQLRAMVAAVADPDDRGLAAPVAEEIIKELTHNNIDRLAPFATLLSDATLSADEKASLAISGWLLGADDAVQNLPIALSLVRVRDLVTRYLREPLPADRQELLAGVLAEEGASVERLAKLIAHMKPPWHDAALAADEDGFLELSAAGQTDDGDFRYIVQLPPEYDPYRRYPTLVVLCGAGNSPEQELSFWAGGAPGAGPDGQALPRRGHAMRHGYITIAIEWQKPHQYEYEFSGREHIAVLTVLRDAARRLSIDADRVYLSGHDIGGEAAWDIAQAHPDLWAGAIPFLARAEKYTFHYWNNARGLPLYFVAGELDGRNVSENAPVWDLYLKKPMVDGKPVFDVTVVEYQGRGHEPFHDEVLHLFDWMSRKTRGGTPRDFQCETLRPWDNFFWWLECQDFPEQFMVHPTEWTGRRPRPAGVSGKIQADNGLLAKSSAGATTVWLSPDMVNFEQPIRITFNGRKLKLPDGGLRPDPGVLLEDVRTRGDRQRPFWARVEAR